jgi:alpha-glucoside transport system permease protein
MASIAAPAETVVRPPDTVAQKILRILGKAPVHILLALIGVMWLVPTLGLLVTSIIAPEHFTEFGWWKIFSKPSLGTLENYRDIFHNGPITHSLWVTAQIAIGGTFLPIIIAALAAYAFAWLEFPGRDWLFIVVIALLVVPLQMALIPIFSLYNSLHIFDTVLSLVLFHTAFGLPFAIFLLRNFFVGIPKDVLESARIDGASEARIFQFLWTWNDLIVALTFGRDTQPITVAIFSQLGEFGSNIEIIAPAAFISLIVPLAVFFAFQRYFVQGLLAGSVK